MSTVTKATRTVKRIEAPRPLRSSTSSQPRSPTMEVKINSVEELIILTETVACQISKGVFDLNLQSSVETMYQHLKLHGTQIEASYKEFLDRFFIVFRNGSQDEKLDKKSRLHLLELIELRAKHWHSSDYMSDYYRHRVTSTEPLLVPTMDAGGGSPEPTPEPIQLLGPGELIKPSGKFPKPTKIPGKNYSKDEVVIRNADSGKVMGIKGRRVHMIEEMSDTIISFQRVSPGAKERLVQITGPNEENVTHAKHLIGDTIRRNASPVRLESSPNEIRSSDASLSDDESHHPLTHEGGGRSLSAGANSSANRVLLHSFSTNDAQLGEYKYTVQVGQHPIKITGANLDAVKTAKLVLDEYFESMAALESGAGSGDFFSITRPTPLDPITTFTPLIPANTFTPLAPVATLEQNGRQSEDEVFAANVNSSNTSVSSGAAEESSETFVRRPRYSRGQSADKKEGMNGNNGTRRTYSAATLLSLASLPLSRALPNPPPPPEIARKDCMNFDLEAYSKCIGPSSSGGSLNEDMQGTPEPE